MEMCSMAKEILGAVSPDFTMEIINVVKSKKYRLENWSATTVHDYESLQGNVYGHPEFEDGTFIVACVISSVSEDGIVTTINGAEYILGEVDPDYEAECPNTKERLIKAWEGV